MPYLPGAGISVWTEVLARGYEGLVDKDEASPYREGHRDGWAYEEKYDGWRMVADRRATSAPPILQ